MNHYILVINPGSTSTKIALFQDSRQLFMENIQHSAGELSRFESVVEQADYRLQSIRNRLEGWLSGSGLSIVVGRGGLLRPCEGGIYEVNQEMIVDLSRARYGEHASNLGAILAFSIAREHNCPAIIADPVTTDEFIEESRISGVPEIVRKCRSHALNIKASARRAASELKKEFEQVNFVIAHLGGGFSIAALRKGRIIDVNDGLLGMGPFSPERAGALPIGGVVELAFSGQYSKRELIEKFSRNSGFKAYLGTNNLVEVLERIESGDSKAELIYKAMIHQIAKEIGAMAAVLKGELSGIILTGGLTRSEKLVQDITTFVSFLGPIFVYPGENEIISLAAAGQRALEGIERIKEYGRIEDE